MTKTDDRIEALIKFWRLCRKYRSKGWPEALIPAQAIHPDTNEETIYPLLKVAAPGLKRIIEDGHCFYEFPAIDICERNILYKFLLANPANFLRFFVEEHCFLDAGYATELNKIWASMVKWARDNELSIHSLPVKRSSLKRAFDDNGFIITRVFKNDLGVWGLRLR